jgi:hypothetical protein
MSVVAGDAGKRSPAQLLAFAPQSAAKPLGYDFQATTRVDGLPSRETTRARARYPRLRSTREQRSLSGAGGSQRQG